MSPRDDFLKDYVDVAERERQLFERYPDARVQVDLEDVRDAAGDLIAWKAAATIWRGPDDPTPVRDWAVEPVPGKTPYTRDSEAMNASTSAVGRAIVLCGFPTKHVASADEVRNRRANGSGDGESAAKAKLPTWPPRNWAELQDGMTQRYGQETWDAFAIISAKVRDVLYPEKIGETLTKAQKDVLWQKALGAALTLEAGERFDGWAPSLDELVQAFAAVGVELPADADEIDALADAAVTGPGD